MVARAKSSPVAQHQGKGGDQQRHNQGPQSGSLIDLPEAGDQGDVHSLQAQALKHHTPAPCLDGIQRELNPDAHQIPQPVPAASATASATLARESG